MGGVIVCVEGSSVTLAVPLLAAGSLGAKGSVAEAKPKEGKPVKVGFLLVNRKRLLAEAPAAWKDDYIHFGATSFELSELEKAYAAVGQAHFTATEADGEAPQQPIGSSGARSSGRDLQQLLQTAMSRLGKGQHGDGESSSSDSSSDASDEAPLTLVFTQKRVGVQCLPDFSGRIIAIAIVESAPSFGKGTSLVQYAVGRLPARSDLVSKHVCATTFIRAGSKALSCLACIGAHISCFCFIESFGRSCACSRLTAQAFSLTK